MKKKTKIVCTLGPASDSVTVLKRMIDAGMNVARLNFSHGSYDHMTNIVHHLKQASKKQGKTVALLQDLQGPKIRLGKLPEEGVRVTTGQTILLSTGVKAFSAQPIPQFPVQYKNLHRDVKVGDRILIDDGYMEVIVLSVKGKTIRTKVRTGGLMKSHKGINCPTATIQAETLTPKDKADLTFGLQLGIDYVALSFVKSAQDIHELRELLKKRGHPEVKIIAKIERHEAVENLEEIAKASDGLMVARGDLGIEIPAEQVPIVQKEIVQLGLIHAKPVIIATQILESMIQNPRATRAEISDAATAIFDHADAFMLSAETSVGKYPIHAVQTLCKVAERTEQELQKKDKLLLNHRFKEDMPITDATCYSAALLAKHINADAIVILTRTGYTARQILKHRPNTPALTITPNEAVKKRLQLVWGTDEIVVWNKKIDSAAVAVKEVPKLLKKAKLVKKNQELVIVNATAGKGQNFIITVVV